VVEEEYSTNAARLLDYDKRHAPAHWRAEVVDVLRAKAFRGALTAGNAGKGQRPFGAMKRCFQPQQQPPRQKE